MELEIKITAFEWGGILRENLPPQKLEIKIQMLMISSIIGLRATVNLLEGGI